MGKRRDGRGRIERERAARARRTANAKPSAALPTTEASQLLAAALDQAGLPELAERARRLEFDENYSREAFPLQNLVAELARANQPGLIDRVTAGDFDSTPADNKAWYATPRGRAEAAEYEQAMADPQIAAAAGRFGQALKDADPRQLERMGKEAVAEITERATGTLVMDDDDPVDPEQVHEVLRGMLGQVGPDGQRLDTPAILAAAEMCGRTGGRMFELGWAHDDVPAEQRGWYAFAQYQGVRLGVTDQPSPGAAAAGFVARVLDGGQCQHCKRLVTTDPSGVIAGDRTLLTGQKWTRDEQIAAGVCLWRREGIHWREGCTDQ